MAEAKTPAKTAAKKVTPKAPQDRKPKAEEAEKPFIPEEVPGWHLLKPFSEVPVWDQAPIISIVEELQGGAAEGAVIDARGEMVNLIGKLAKALLSVAKDTDEYTKFVSGRDGLQNAANLAFGWVRNLGESEASES